MPTFSLFGFVLTTKLISEVKFLITDHGDKTAQNNGSNVRKYINSVLVKRNYSYIRQAPTNDLLAGVISVYD